MVFAFVTRVTDRFKDFVSWALHNVQNTVKQVAVFLVTGFLILWIAVILYASFYHVHVPSQSIIRSAHFKFRVCPSGVGMCSFPAANVTLGAGGRAEVLGRGQRYNMLLEMEVPDSAGNRDLGMFMVVIKVYDRHGHIVQESSRSATLKYQSDLLLTIQTLAWSPLYIIGFVEQKQNLKIDLFEDYLDDVYHPAVGVLIEIHSRQLEMYTAQLKLHATYTGIRYYMFYWPLTSAFFGIGFNCMWLTLIALLSWYKLGAHVSPDTQENTEKKQLTFQQREERVKTLIDEDNQAGGQQAETGFRYIQPFTMTTSYRDAETIGEARPEAGGEHQRGSSSSSRGQQDASSLLRQRGRTETPS